VSSPHSKPYRTRKPPRLSRRELLRRGFLGMGLCFAGSVPLGCGGKGPNRRVSNLADVGPLGEADANGLRLPAGFSGRVVARSGEVPPGASGYVWHQAPDGGATFATGDGGWIYVSNSELGAAQGGVGALRFDAAGRVFTAYSILAGTSRNCAGGTTPWQSWLSCEEFPGGRVWECDPFGIAVPLVRPALGVFTHEAAAVDPLRDHVYMTEDEVDGRLYRYVPPDDSDADVPDLDNGRLEVARVVDASGEGAVDWLEVPDPTFSGDTPTRRQVPESTAFLGGEGIWYGDGVMYFTTKIDNRVWAYDVETRRIEVIYDDDVANPPILSGVDNVTVSAQGDVLVAEDGGDMQIVALVPTGEIVPLVQIVGHERSEVTGPAFDPSGTRLYFSSQRGAGNPPAGGVTYEISGPFFR
jgi:uncharacterized protein